MNDDNYVQIALMLKDIKNYCKNQDCDSCPFDGEGYCKLSGLPCNWDLITDEGEE